MTDEEELTLLRERIAGVTADIVRLVGKRNELAKKAGLVKNQASLPMHDERTEDSLLELVVKECDTNGVSREAGLRILNTLLAESKRAQGTAQVTNQETPMQSFARALELQREGKKIIRLDVGEPDFKPPARVISECIRALSNFKTHYTLTRGVPELVDSLRGFLKRKWGYDADDRQIIVTSGGRFAVYAGIASVVGEGDSAIVLEPNWPAYEQALRFVGARPIEVPSTLEEEWLPPLQKVRDSIKPNTKAIIISYPNNPSGKVIDLASFKGLVDLANDFSLTLISDETYIGYSFKECPTVLKANADKFILISSFSKTWAMTGFRIGFAVSSSEIIDSMISIASLMLTSVPEFVQYAAIEALKCDKEADENTREMKARVEAVCKALRQYDALDFYEPDGAMYVFPRLSKNFAGSSNFAQDLLARKLVSVTPGTAFGNYPAHFRISLGQPTEVLLEGVRRIGESLA